MVQGMVGELFCDGLWLEIGSRVAEQFILVTSPLKLPWRLMVRNECMRSRICYLMGGRKQVSGYLILLRVLSRISKFQVSSVTQGSDDVVMG